MRFYIIWILFLSISTPVAAGNRVDDFGELFEAVCVGSGLVAQNVEPLARAWIVAKGMEMIKIPDEQFPIIGAGTKEAWGIKGNQSAYIISRGEKAADSFVSISCSVAIQDVKSKDITDYLERHYRLRKITEEVQGTNNISIYSASLLGYTKPIALSIQSVHDITVVSLFDHH